MEGNSSGTQRDLLQKEVSKRLSATSKDVEVIKLRRLAKSGRIYDETAEDYISEEEDEEQEEPEVGLADSSDAEEEGKEDNDFSSKFVSNFVRKCSQKQAKSLKSVFKKFSKSPQRALKDF